VNPALRRLSAFTLLAASFGLAAFVIHKQPQVDHYIRSIGPWAYPLAIALFTLVASAPFSVTDALAIMNGAIFGPVWGSIVNAIGLVFAAMLGYWINRRASHLLDLEAMFERLPHWVKRFPVASPMFLLSVRVIPGFGGTVATATAATFRVPLWVHVWTMCAIAIPICTLLAIFGNRVTVFVHSIPEETRTYIRRHRPHFPESWRIHHEEPRVTPTAHSR
jgi:uncharacterized membrane protein YdjX (TVP38/TMEM64 family)